METGRGPASLGSQGDGHLSSWLRAAHGSFSGAEGRLDMRPACSSGPQFREKGGFTSHLVCKSHDFQSSVCSGILPSGSRSSLPASVNPSANPESPSQGQGGALGPPGPLLSLHGPPAPLSP